ncbi:MAG: ATP-binding protein [Deltaproteobacteria bacterium]|nr:ATP-binding protein [Deltaproteobacteria bacterium]
MSPFASKEKGTGLGLAISHRIIKEHKGHIKVKSKIEEGTTFSVTLPV